MRVSAFRKYVHTDSDIHIKTNHRSKAARLPACNKAGAQILLADIIVISLGSERC